MANINFIDSVAYRELIDKRFIQIANDLLRLTRLCNNNSNDTDLLVTVGAISHRLSGIANELQLKKNRATTS